VVQIVRDEVEEAARGEERERALQRLEERDRAKAFFQVAVQR
jgi:hypothetical protein